MSFSSPPERPSISRSVSPVSTVSRSHSGYRNDAQDGYHRVPYVPQRDREIEMTEQHHSTPAERHATNPNVLGTDRSLPALPNKYNTVIHATDVESETHQPIFRSDDALLSRTEKLRDIIGKFCYGRS